MREACPYAASDGVALEPSNGARFCGDLKFRDRGGPPSPEPADVLHGEGVEPSIVLPSCAASRNGDGSLAGGR